MTLSIKIVDTKEIPKCEMPGWEGWMSTQAFRLADSISRRSFIGGSDARIIMGSDEAALVRLWREKRGEAEPDDLSGNLIVQLGRATEELNRAWYERNTGRQVRDVQRRVRHSAIPKALMPEDAKEAIGHGVRAKRSKAGAVSFDILTAEAAHAPVQ
jgi:YqaJ-like viral recombinase domain